MIEQNCIYQFCFPLILVDYFRGKFINVGFSCISAFIVRPHMFGSGVDELLDERNGYCNPNIAADPIKEHFYFVVPTLLENLFYNRKYVE